MLGLGIPVVYRTAPIGDAPPAPVKQVIYESDFTTDLDGWTDPVGIGGLDAPIDSPGGLIDAIRYVSAAPFGTDRFIRLNLSPFNIPTQETTYTVKFTFESNIQPRAWAKLGAEFGTFTNYVSADTPTDYSSNITATNPTTFDIHFQALNSTMENAHFKGIELFYYT